MPVTPKIHFINSPGVGLVMLFNGTADPWHVAMADDCCCDINTNRPGYIIYARDCCTGEQLTDYYLRLEHPPYWAFIRSFSTPLASPKRCFHFRTSDIEDAILFAEPAYDDPKHVLAHRSLYPDYEGCNACRCDSELGKCCFNYIDYPTEPTYGRTGQKYFEFSGITAKAGLFTCLSYTAVVPGAIDPVTGGDLWVQTDAFTVPNGVYAGPDCGETTPVSWGTVTTKYYLEGTCHTPANVPDQVSTAFFSEDLIDLGIFVPRVGILGGALWRHPSASSGFNNCDQLTVNNEVYSDDAGSGGTLTFTPCCPDEDGGI